VTLEGRNVETGVQPFGIYRYQSPPSSSFVGQPEGKIGFSGQEAMSFKELEVPETIECE
jgi:hypothetical protein